jgi:hypothetical protein
MKNPPAPAVKREAEEDWGGEMTDQKPWRLADLIFEPMGDDRRERATIWCRDREADGRYSITASEQEWSNLDEDEVDPALNFLFNLRAAGK